MKTFDLAINDCIILSGHNGYQPVLGSVGIRDGRIQRVGEGKIYSAESKELLDGNGKILMPGLINGHCHGDMTFARGMGDDLTLLEQNQKFADTNWFYDLIDDEDRYWSRVLTYVEALLSGTTFLMENMYWGLGARSVDAMKATGIKGALAQDLREDFTDPGRFVPPQKMKDFADRCRAVGIIPVIGNISEEDFADGLIDKARDYIADLGCAETRHLAENTWRMDLIRDKLGTTSIQYLKSRGALHGNMICSHAIYLTEEELSIMAAEDVKVVNTPLCEMKIADGIAPIPAMLKAGVTVGIGTDGAMWNNSNDIFREMKGMVLLHSIQSGVRALTARDALNMATIQGAKVFGLEKEIGTIEPGKKADLILIDANQPHMSPLRWRHNENVASTVVYCATGRDVTDVLIDGNLVVRNRNLMTMHVPEVLERASVASEKLSGYEGSRRNQR